MKNNLQSTEFVSKTAYPEQVWCRIPQAIGQDLLVRVCYRTPTSSIYNIDLDELLRQLLVEISSQHVLLMGDFNYSDIKWHSPSNLPLPKLANCLSTVWRTASSLNMLKSRLELLQPAARHSIW